MLRSGIFWGIVLITLGSLQLIDMLGILPFDLTGLILPTLLIVLGVWVIWGISRRTTGEQASSLSLPMEGARRLRLSLKHGAGRLRVDSGAGLGLALDGKFGFGVRHESARSGDELSVHLRPQDDWFLFSAPWGWWRGEPPEWTIHLTKEIPVDLELETGASDTVLDLESLHLGSLRLLTGASSTEVRLPGPQGHVPVALKGGAASISVRLPMNVQARVRATTDLGSVSVDRSRFTQEGSTYTSSGFDQATDRFELEAGIGAGSVDIR